jgi:uncharacterized delta-60 repeat protein
MRMKTTPLLLALTTLVCNLNAARCSYLWARLTVLATLAFGLSAQAAVTEAWVQRYNNNVVSNSDDQAFKVVRDAAGDIIVAGYTDEGTSGHDMLTIKYSGVDGSVIWQQRYAGPANDHDEVRAVAVDGGGNVIVTGSSWNVSFGNSSIDYYTAKYAAADGALLWEKRYNGPANSDDQPSAVALDGGGNVMVTGSSRNGPPNWDNDYYTAKYAAADGALLWEKRYNGPANSDDQASAVALDGSGNVVVTGSSIGSGSNTDYYTAKYAAANGALLWEQRYNGPVNGSDQAQAVAVDSSGNVVVTGHSNNDYYTAKYAAADGALLWEKRYNGSENDNDEARAVAVDGSGNVMVTGSSVALNDGDYSSDYYTAKYASADGALLWEQRYNGPENHRDEARAVAVDGNGNVVVTGVTGWRITFDGWLGADYYTAKYAAADGALLWEKRYNGPANYNDEAQAVAVDGSGNVVVTGGSQRDFYTARYAAADGALLWEKRYNGAANSYDEAQAVALDSSGNVVVTGVTGWRAPFDGRHGADYYTAKYAADGALLWDQRYNGPANSSDFAQAVAVDGSGNLVVTGSSATIKYLADGTRIWTNNGGGALAVDGSGNVVVTGSSKDDYYTAKYAAADGTLLWEKRYNGPANSSDFANAVGVDSSGNVVVTGFSYNGANFDYYTAKYAAADGALLWEKRYNNNSDDFAWAVAVDGSGNVVVTGESRNGALIYDYYTAKYAAADGALLWEKRYNSPWDSDDVARAVAVDGSGNVVVTGYSNNGGGYDDTDYYTAKYAAADGALLWEKRYNGLANKEDQAKAVAVDGSGNVVVSGSSYNGTNSDYYTAKYAAADGALLWEKRYNGPANGDDRVGSGRSLALGPNGTVAVTGSSGGDFATVVYQENLPPVSIARIPTGVRVRFNGVPGRSYTIERAPAITGPWSTLAAPTAPMSGLIEYVDTNALRGTAFYRTVQP